MVRVARLLFVETCVVSEPFVGRGRADEGVEAVVVLVEGDEAVRNVGGEV